MLTHSNYDNERHRIATEEQRKSGKNRIERCKIIIKKATKWNAANGNGARIVRLGLVMWVLLHTIANTLEMYYIHSTHMHSGLQCTI